MGAEIDVQIASPEQAAEPSAAHVPVEVAGVDEMEDVVGRLGRGVCEVGGVESVPDFERATGELREEPVDALARARGGQDDCRRCTEHGAHPAALEQPVDC